MIISAVNPGEGVWSCPKRPPCATYGSRRDCRRAEHPAPSSPGNRRAASTAGNRDSPSSKDSFNAESCVAQTPGSRRATASMTTAAASSRRSARNRRSKARHPPGARRRARPRLHSGRRSAAVRRFLRSSRAICWVNLPALRRKQNHLLCRALRSGQIDSTASKIGSGFSSMPSPPPNGRSSTVRCRS